jgi:uncharacterized protein (TIGR03437 family)
VELPVAAAAPGLFSSGAVWNADGSRNGADSPAAAGSIVFLSGTGRGQTAARGSAPPVGVTIGGARAEVDEAADAPGQIGIFQIKVRIPQGMPSGTSPVVVTIGGISSQPGVTVVVK